MIVIRSLRQCLLRLLVLVVTCVGVEALTSTKADAIVIAEYVAGGMPASPTTQGWVASEIVEAGSPSPPLATLITTDPEANAGPGIGGWIIRDFLDGNSETDLPQYFYNLTDNDFALMQSNGWIFTATVRMDGLNAGRDMRLLNIDQGGDLNNPFSIKVNARYQTSSLDSNLQLLIQQGSSTLTLNTDVPASEFNTLVFADENGDGSFTISVNGSLLNGGVPIDSTPSSSTQILGENVLAIGANSSGNEGGGMEYQLVRLEANDVPPRPTLVIDRATGNMQLVNTTGSSRHLVGYSITSSNGALNSSGGIWTSITETYDRNGGTTPGDGSVDPNDDWVKLTKPGSRSDLSELDPDGDGALWLASQVIDLGSAWIRNLSEDISAEILHFDGTVETVTIQFVGNDDDAFVFGDLNFDGEFTSSDFTGPFLSTFGTDTSSYSPAERYQAGDFDDNGVVDDLDFLIFNDAYKSANPGAAALSFATAVPEPATGLLACFGLIGLAGVGVNAKHRRARLARRGIAAALLCGLLSPAALALPIDISGAFNTDLIATVEGAEEGWGFGGGGNQMLASDSLAKSIDPSFAGVPDDGIVSDGTHTFTLGPLDGPNSVTKVLPGEANYELYGGAPATIDIANGSYSDLTVLFFWGSWGASGQEGEFTVNYTTGDPDTFTWFVADWANPGNTNDGATPLVLGPMNRYRRDGEFNGTASLFKQTFNVDPWREIESLVFGAGSAQDSSGNNGYFSILALDGTSFEAPKLKLTVNELTGEVTLQNDSAEDIVIDYYSISTTSGGVLDTQAWSTLEGQGAHGGVWTELTRSATKVSEGAFGEDVLLSSGMQGISLGNLYDEGTNLKDLQFDYHIVGTHPTSLLKGNVQYVTTEGIAGDFNGDGIVDAADYTVWRNNLGANESVLANPGDMSGTVDAGDYGVWKANFGLSTGQLQFASTAVPEPSAFGLLLALPLAWGGCRLVGRRGLVLLVGVGMATWGTFAHADATPDRHYTFGDDGEGASSGGVLGSGNGNGTTWDSAGSSMAGDYQDLIVVGDPRYVAVNDRDGANGTWAASFDGDDYLITPINFAVPDRVWNESSYFPSSSFPHNYSAIQGHAAQVWVKPDASTQGVRQDIFRNSGQVGISITPANTWGLAFGNPDPIDSGAEVAYGEWTHLQVVGGYTDLEYGRSRTGGVLYVNGVVQAISNSEYTFQVNQPLTVGATQLEGDLGGATPSAPENFYHGLIDEMNISLWGTNSQGTDYGSFILPEDNDWIQQALAGHPPGDINLDGQVSGDGTGHAESDDVSALLEGWLSVQIIDGRQMGDWNSRLMGDLNFDGAVDLDDAFILREGLSQSGLGYLNFDLLFATAVPEPSSLTLGVALACGLGAYVRRQPRSAKG